MTGRPRAHDQGITVDLTVLTVRDDRLQVLLIERGKEPFRGRLALPGGFIRRDEDLDHGAARELHEETGLHEVHLEQLKTYGAPGRDPRGRVVTVAYLAIAPDLPVPVPGTDASKAFWRPVTSVLDRPGSLAFDHAEILRDALERARSKLEYTTIGAAFCAEYFTISELRRVYEVVWGVPVDPRNFHRKVVHADGFLIATGSKRTAETGRPAELYRRGSAVALTPPMLRQSDSGREPAS